jgi:hypothetical protein
VSPRPSFAADPARAAGEALLGLLLAGVEPPGLAERLSPEHFPCAAQGAVFADLVKRRGRGRAVHPALVGEALADDPDVLARGGYAWLTELIERRPDPASAGELARQLVGAWGRRTVASTPAADPDAWAEAARRALKTFEQAGGGPELKATPFVWTDPKRLPRRDFLYGRHYARGFCSATFAPGGVGKSAHAVVEALSMVTGRPLLGERAPRPLKVWILNLEDPLEETRRRVAAACLHYRIGPEDLEGRLFLDSGRDTPVVVARPSREGVVVMAPVVERLEAEIAARGIDVVLVDPFVACHEVAENDNSGINSVAAVWRGIADRRACAVELIHHARKAAPGEHGPLTADDGRGASALKDAARSVRTLSPAPAKQAEKWKVGPGLAFRVDDGKRNLAPPGAARWRRLVSVDLENGPPGLSDEVGVATAFEPPDAFEGVTAADTFRVQQAVAAGEWRDSFRARAWVGRAIAEALDLDLADAADYAQVKDLQKTWLASGVLVIAKGDDGRRRPKDFIQVGTWVTPGVSTEE